MAKVKYNFTLANILEGIMYIIKRHLEEVLLKKEA